MKKADLQYGAPMPKNVALENHAGQYAKLAPKQQVYAKHLMEKLGFLAAKSISKQLRSLPPWGKGMTTGKKGMPRLKV